MATSDWVSRYLLNIPDPSGANQFENFLVRMKFYLFYSEQGFGVGVFGWSRAVTLARPRLHLKYFFNNSRKLYGT